MSNDKTQRLQSTSAIARLFGISSRRVQQLTQDGVIFQKDGKGYDLESTVQNYIKNLQNKASGKEEKNQMVELEKERLDADISLKKSKARVAEIELEELEGKMHRSEDVESMTTDLVLNIRSMLLTLPGLLAVEVAEISDPAETAEIIKKSVYDILESLSNYKYDSTEYKRRVRERQGWNHEHEDEE